MNQRSNRIVFLGTGTSSGIPVVGCPCPACTSEDPRDNRTRTSALLQTRDHEEAPWENLLIDTSIDLRYQLLREGSPLVRHVVYTHAHIDHFFGLDELRAVQFHIREPIEIFASEEVQGSIRNVYGHMFDKNAQKGGGILHVKIHPLEDRFRAGPVELRTLDYFHGNTPIHGFRWGPMAYMTDCSKIPEETFPLLEGLDTLVLGMLRKRPHPTHFNLDQALEAVGRIRPRQTFFVHMTHDLVHAEVEKELPEKVRLAYDSLKVELPPFDPVEWNL